MEPFPLQAVGPAARYHSQQLHSPGMLIESLSVPFKASPTTSDIISSSIIDIDGLLSYRDHTLILEYRTLTLGYRALDTGMGKSPVQTLQLRLEDLAEISVRKQLFRQAIIVRPREMSRLDEVPGTQNHMLELKIDRKHLEEAERLASRVALDLAELDLSRIAPELYGGNPAIAPERAPADMRAEGRSLPDLSAESSDERDAVAAALRRINDAWLDGRTGDLAPLFHEDIVLAGPRFSDRTTGRDAAVAGFASLAGRSRVVMYRELGVQVDRIADTAVAVLSFEMIREEDGTRYRSAGRDMWVFALHAGRWLAVWRTLTDVQEERAG